MPTQRIIKSTFIGLNNEPIRNAAVQVIHMQGNTINNIEYPQVTKNFITNREGKINFILWCNEEGERSSFYRFVLPGGESFDAIVPVGTSDLELSVLREGGGDSSDPQHQSLITYILNQAGVNLATNTVAGKVRTNTNSNDPVVYLKSEVDTLIASVSGADLTNYYNKPQTDTLLNTKSDKSNTYTKTQTDALIGGVTVDLSGYYTKTQTDGLVSPKANQSSTYTKVEVDGLINPKVNSTEVYTKGQTDTLISSATSTGSNVGVGGVGVYKQKTGSNLEFKNINAGSSKVTVTSDTVNSEIDIDVIEANLTLGNIGGILPITKGGTGQVTASAALTALGGATSASLTAHTSDTSNPHATTAAQVGAIATTARAAANGVASLDANTLVPDTQISSNIARTSAVALKADLANPTFTGAVTIPTPTAGDNSTKAASTAFITTAISTKADTSALTSHTSNISNPHNTTAAQVGNTVAQWNSNKLQGVDIISTAPTNGQVLTYNSISSKWEPTTSSGGGSSPVIHPGYRSGIYYPHSSYVSGVSNNTPIPQSAIAYTPMIIYSAVTIDRIGLNVSTAVSNALCRLAIYSNVSALPGNLIVDAGELDCSTIGGKEIPVSLTLSPGVYWFAGTVPTTNSVPNITIISSNFSNVSVLGQSSISTNSNCVLRQGSYTYAAYPSTAPVNSLSYFVNNNCPLFWFRVV